MDDKQTKEGFFYEKKSAKRNVNVVMKIMP